MSGARDFYRITTVDETDSTNRQVREWAARGEGEGAVLIARAQTAGRGRMGRSFYSPAGTGLYLSVLLRPGLAAADASLLTTAAAVAGCRAIEAVTAKRPAIKWVNDLLLNGKKIAGILAEGVWGAYAVLGVGVNLCTPAGGFPPELEPIAGALYGEGPVREDERSGLAARFLEEFYTLYTRLPDTAFLKEYRARCITLGSRVLVPANAPYEAVAEDIDDAGALILRLDSGETRRLLAGEVSLRCRES